jgi:hypothetical protein
VLLALVAVAAGVLGRLAAGRRSVRGRPVGLGLLAAGAVAVLAASAGSGRWAVAAVLAGFALLAAFAWSNRARTGMVLAAVGLLANATVVAADGGMPVEGLSAAVASGYHHGLRPGDRITPLADVVPLPFVGDRASPGDLALAAGAAVAVFAWPEDAGARRRRARREAPRQVSLPTRRGLRRRAAASPAGSAGSAG